MKEVAAQKNEEEWRFLIGYPSELIKNKVMMYLDHHCKEFTSKSPFLALAA